MPTKKLLLEKLRGFAFWQLDKLKGGQIKQSLALLERIEGPVPPADSELESYHKARINELLAHCVATVPAYADCKPLLQEENPLKNWPVVNKAKILDGGDRHLSDKFERASLIGMSTSGSTGTPFTCWQDPLKKRHVNAEVLFYGSKIGYTIGKKQIFFRSVVKSIAKSGIKQAMQNVYLIDCKDLSDEGIRNKLNEIKRISKRGGTMILSYASTLEAFRKYFEKYGYDAARGCKVYGIASGSEMLHDVTREAMRKAFGCKVVSRYSNEENGFLGQDDEVNNVFIHNRANYYIEILKFDSDEPVKIGEIGRIVITDLYNYAMPMVRYDCGDVGAWQEVMVNGSKRLAIGQFGGRKVDMIFDCNGNIISPHSITNGMWKYSDRIKQFQFIQLDSAKYRLNINTDEKIDETALIEMLKSIVGQECDIALEYCQEIPVLASGKRRYIVNKMFDKK